ncbi:hypothetical protein IQ273_18610 [Nodosilinea sp. LEGE 07298]|uniref:hypothetical protein n=1 Tax=Nodosilinea sp. LEGE 07298 TaxID=2777970 RepID=UPI00187F0DBB|nr:hypothetical protein [Nodosilinea sp. LEGE 07298]MBE9111420.1 hypothetical protein [Nodosilinea sp. LEGE 07298]
MSAKNVAVEGDVQAVPGTVPYSPADEGEWTAGSIRSSMYEQLKIGGKATIYKAECTFSFTGRQTLPNGAKQSVSGSETVTLEAKKPTKLQKSILNVLVNGDEISSEEHGNKLQVTTSNKLSSS